MNGVSTSTPAQDMETIQALLGKNLGRRYIHLVISFDKGVSEQLAYKVAEECAAYYSNEYQFVFALHTNTENLHAHIILNAVNVRTGKKFSQSRSEMLRFREYVNKCLQSHGLKPIGQMKTSVAKELSFDESDEQCSETILFCSGYEDSLRSDVEENANSFFGAFDPEEAEQIREAEEEECIRADIVRHFNEQKGGLPEGIEFDEAEMLYERWRENQQLLEEGDEDCGFFSKITRYPNSEAACDVFKSK